VLPIHLLFIPIGDSMTATASKLRVVVVDDHSIVRETLVDTLAEQPDMEVVGQARDGREAVAVALQQRPDVIVMDISMPGLGGLDATVRLSVDLPRVKIVGFSMYSATDMERLMTSAGAAAYLNKQCTVPTLLDTIRRTASHDSC
jgi:DNA-binding NarL/FixJ family response regulator